MRERGRIALVLGLGQTLGRGALAVYTIVLVRELSAVEYGDLAYAVAASAIAVAVADAGFSRLIVREVARAPQDIGLIRGMLQVRILGLIAVVALIVVVVAVDAVRFDGALVAALLAYIAAETVSFGFESTAVATERPWRFAGVQALSATAIGGALAWVVVADDPDAAMAMGALAGAAAIKTLGHVVVWRGVVGRADRADRLPVRRWLRQALPFLLLTVCAVAYYRLGILILHSIRGPAETAPFAAGARVLDAVGLAGYVAFSAVSPLVSRHHRDSPERLWRLWTRMIAVAAPPAAALAVGVMLAAEPIAALLFGASYEESAGSVIRLLGPAMALLLLQSLSGSVLLMSDDQRLIIRLTVFTLAANVALTVALVTLAGAEGAAAAISIAEAVTFVTFALLIARRHRVRRPRGA